MIYHKIPLSTYLFTEQNFNTSTLSVVAQAYVRQDAFFFLNFNEKALPPFKSMYLNEYRKEQSSDYKLKHTKRFPLYTIVSAL